MLNVITFLWSTPGYRSKYTPEHVRTLARMVERHYPHKHRFICYTDSNPWQVGDVIHWRSLWNDHAEIPNPTWPDRGPSCYRRLRLFEFSDEPFVMLDLDLVITGDLAPLWNRPEPCVTYRPPGLSGGVNGAMLLCNEPDRFRFVWDLFDPTTSPATTQALGYCGSDQAWFSACLLHCSAAWTKADGLYDYCSLRKPQQRTRHTRARPTELPSDARVVFFHGKPDPWECEEAWIKDAYR